MTPLPDLTTYQDPEALTPPDLDLCPYCDRTDGHEPGCSEAAEGEPSYRYTPTRWNEEHPW